MVITKALFSSKAFIENMQLECMARWCFCYIREFFLPRGIVHTHRNLCNTEYCWRSKDELISKVLLCIPTQGRASIWPIGKDLHTSALSGLLMQSRKPARSDEQLGQMARDSENSVLLAAKMILCTSYTRLCVDERKVEYIFFFRR